MRMKVCYRCKKQKQISLFSRDAQKKDQLRTYCKSCEAIEYSYKCCGKRSVQKKYRQTKAFKKSNSKAKIKWLKNNKKELEKSKIRQRTKRKYGKAPTGYCFHHFEPYHEDNFCVVLKQDHDNYHSYMRRVQ